MTGTVNVRRQPGAPPRSLHSASWISARPASFDPAVLQVRLVDDAVVASDDLVHAWIERVGEDPSVARIRTAALFPLAAERLRAAGFEVADTLALLRLDLATWSDVQSPPRRGRDADATTATLRRRHHDAAAAIDRVAFGLAWGHSASELADIRTATPTHCAFGQFRTTGGLGRVFGRKLIAFAIAGASSERGYLQRLSVAPDHQHEGHGRILTLAAVRWMRRLRLRDCLVNTSVDNAAALGLYASVGFDRLPECLQVLEFDLRSLR